MSPGEQAPPPLSPDGFQALLAREAPSFGLELAPGVLSSLAAYLAELDSWRRKINLTGDLSAEELSRHALESALPIELIPHGERLIDIGSGAGFPGLQIAIARPDLSITLVEPRGKRCAFLRHVVRTLGLRNVRIAECRAEEMKGQTFGVASTRALGNLPSWLERESFLQPGGILLAWTTDCAALAATLRFALEKSIPVPGSAKREIAVFRKP